jgi:hypothetical protein
MMSQQEMEETMDQRQIQFRLERAAWPVAAEQVAPLRLLLDSTTHGGATTSYMETALSHIIFVEDKSYVLRRPLRLPQLSLLAPEDRWHWCEEQANRDCQSIRKGNIRVLPIVQRGNSLKLGGLGEVLDWVLERSLAVGPKQRDQPTGPHSRTQDKKAVNRADIGFTPVP